MLSSICGAVVPRPAYYLCVYVCGGDDAGINDHRDVSTRISSLTIATMFICLAVGQYIYVIVWFCVIGVWQAHSDCLPLPYRD